MDISKERDTGLLTEYLLEADYIFAKTMPKIPHSYTHIRTWKNKKNFYFCVMAIRTYGYVEFFQGNEYKVKELSNIYSRDSWRAEYEEDENGNVHRRKFDMRYEGLEDEIKANQKRKEELDKKYGKETDF